MRTFLVYFRQTMIPFAVVEAATEFGAIVLATHGTQVGSMALVAEAVEEVKPER